MTDALVSAEEITSMIETLQQKVSQIRNIWSIFLFIGTAIIIGALFGILYYSASSTIYLDVKQPIIYALGLAALFTIILLIVSSSGSRWSDAKFAQQEMAELEQLRHNNRIGDAESLRKIISISSFLEAKPYFIGPLNFRDKEDENEACLCEASE